MRSAWRLQRARGPQLLARRDREQRLVRSLAPKEERQARCELEVRQRVRHSRQQGQYSQDESRPWTGPQAYGWCDRNRADEHRRDQLLDACIETIPTALVKEWHQAIDVLLGDRTTECAAGETGRRYAERRCAPASCCPAGRRRSSGGSAYRTRRAS